MQIGEIPITPPIILAPMAGITDYPFRRLCREQGAGLVYSEFVSAHGIVRENTRTLDMIRFTPAERPIGVQIFGDEPRVMAAAAALIVERFSPDLIDINYGCPVPKVTRKGAGSAALQDLDLMEDITRAVVAAVAPLPVTVKMRSGWDNRSIVIPAAGPRLEQAGVRAITLHPRTTREQFSGQADWSLIRRLKETVTIPVIGNGDVTSPQTMENLFTRTGCDAVMVGRAALGRPWLFKSLKTYYEHRQLDADPAPEIQMGICRRHFELMLEHHGTRTGLNLMRKHFGWYIRNFPGAAAVRRQLVTAPDADTATAILDHLSAGTLPESGVPAGPQHSANLGG